MLEGPSTTNLLSLILVIVTGAYVLLTWRIAQANQGMLDNIREQYRDSLRPVVFPTLQVRDQIVVRLAISNTGKSPAYRLQVNLDKDFLQWGNRKNIREFSVFNKEIAVFAPGAEIVIDLAQGFNLERETDGEIVTPLEFEISLSYAAKSGELFEEMIPIDLSPYLQTHTPKTVPESLALIAKHMKELAETPQALAESFELLEKRLEAIATDSRPR